MAKKSKAAAAADGKISKAKTGTRSTSPRIKKSSPPRKSAVEKVAAEAAAVTASTLNPTDDQIQMRAYFISERRRRLDLPGDANSDWLEAKRQLLAETRD